MHEFYLSTESETTVDAVHGAPIQRWQPVPHSGLQRPAYLLLAGERLQLAGGLEIGDETKLLVNFGAAHDALSADGAVLVLELRVESEAQAQLLAELPLPPGPAGMAPREACLDLSPYAGKRAALQLRVGAGAQGNPNGDWIAVFEVVLAPCDALARVRARAFHTERAQNELAHFEHVYQHHVYQSDAAGDAPATETPRADCRTLDEWAAGADAGSEPESESAIDPMARFPSPGELSHANRDAFHYSHALLTRAIQAPPPNFPARLAAMQRDRPLRILSLCSGAARIEASFATTPGVNAHWTLMDLNEGLLQDAARAFPGDSPPDLVVGNLNQVRDFGRRFDVVLCVSGLHHMVELERVVDFIHDTLEEDGEFWSIGEAIGRNGNRLWPGDYAVANAFFRSLPERLRRNRNSGQVDTDLPRTDFSNATFEGIRSEDIETLLSRRLEPVHLYRRNCFLWRVVDLAYADNYDLENPEDVDWLKRAVAAELAHYRNGGRATELHAVFRRARL